ncbi:hypothetical protein T440DRAFT_242215 [Plenodomus tracheiphilus IPT5]|uniref:Uncharacterized protein n=1 Tax=Plenodomus tracheiphilus IPT5 TaxID=1408161 RepID=A0A6A7BKU0_9PLEO|nr:hypothetical protein T440DRAFT_242215 [Plenodomus tracheiphilus IPT5]
MCRRLAVFFTASMTSNGFGTAVSLFVCHNDLAANDLDTGSKRCRYTQLVTPQPTCADEVLLCIAIVKVNGRHSEVDGHVARSRTNSAMAV